MKEISLKGLDEVIYHETLENGLPIYIWKSGHVHSFQGVLNVFYGADNTEFTVKNKKYQVRRGSAHYLEHVMCESNDGEPLLSKFNKLGSHSNAVTNYIKTAFEFEGTKCLRENILLLLETIFEKEFTEKMIEHERTPILEEMRMRLDNPGVLSYFALNQMLYSKYPNQTDLIGTEEDILAISMEELQLLYKTFYHPSNMAFVVTGNVDPYEVVSIVKEYFQGKDIPKWTNPKLKKYKEGKRVCIKKEQIEVNVEVPEVEINVKIPMSIFKQYDPLKVFNIVRLLLSSNFGSTSLFKEELLEKKLIYTLYFGAYKMYDYMILELGARTKFPDEVLPILVDRLQHMNLYFKDIERKIKAAVANLVLGYEDVLEVNSIICNTLTYDKKIIDNEKELLESITKKDVQEIYDLLSLKEMAILTVLPKKEKASS